jgi:hypothetical protein
MRMRDVIQMGMIASLALGASPVAVPDMQPVSSRGRARGHRQGSSGKLDNLFRKRRRMNKIARAARKRNGCKR